MKQASHKIKPAENPLHCPEKKKTDVNMYEL
jgi:hypothetical protein